MAYKTINQFALNFDTAYKTIQRVSVPSFKLFRPWIIHEWMGNSMLHKVQNKAVDGFDWLSQWLE